MQTTKTSKSLRPSRSLRFEEGRLRFNLQVEGLARLVQDRLKRLF
jgi:hypothetical protein